MASTVGSTSRAFGYPSVYTSGKLTWTPVTSDVALTQNEIPLYLLASYQPLQVVLSIQVPVVDVYDLTRLTPAAAPQILNPVALTWKEPGPEQRSLPLSASILLGPPSGGTRMAGGSAVFESSP